MTYKFTQKNGTERFFNDRTAYIRAFENQARVERLQELNRDIVYEEMLHNGEPIMDIVRETGILIEIEADIEDR